MILLCSRLDRRLDHQTHVRELAFAHELAAREREFAVTESPETLFDKSIVWFLPGPVVSPRLWDYSRQAVDFAAGLELQGNRLFCSSREVAYWENKAYMHRRFEQLGIPTPRTAILTGADGNGVEGMEGPVLVKQEHSAGSAGIEHFETTAAARTFAEAYAFRPTESLIVQEVVPGATRDMRLTMVGGRAIESATYWRTKSKEALAEPRWTTTATTYDSVVEHGTIPEHVVSAAADYLRKLELRTAGIDLMWVDDDVSRPPLVLEVSPYYQPNPPKPARYRDWTYKRYKSKPYRAEGYIFEQYRVFREIAAQILDQELY